VARTALVVAVRHVVSDPPPMSTSHNGDLETIVIMTVLSMGLVLVPFIPASGTSPGGSRSIVWCGRTTTAPMGRRPRVTAVEVRPRQPTV
jgi:hypothetical protein